MTEAAPKILVVDDYAYNRLVFGERLCDIARVDVVEAATGERARQLAREYDFAMLLIGVNMPDPDGFTLAHVLRQELRTEATPIVFVRAEEDRDGGSLMEGYRLGAAEFFIEAPLHGKIFADKIRLFLEMSRKRMAVRRNAEPPDERQREQLEREYETLRRHAVRDGLAILSSRELFHARLGAAVALASRRHTRCALALLDLDGSRELYSRHGAAIADAVIQATVDCVTRVLREAGTIARLGPEEFALILEELGSPLDAERVIRDVRSAVAEPLLLQTSGDSLQVRAWVGASLGAAVYPDHANDIDDLVTLAALTVGTLKAGGGGAKVYPGHA